MGVDASRDLARLAKMPPLARALRAEELRLEALEIIGRLADVRAQAIAELIAAGGRPADIARQLGVTPPVVTKALNRAGSCRPVSAETAGP